MNNNLKQLRLAKQALRAIDAKMRNDSKCEKCGLPTSGFVPAGMTKAQAGLCVCESEATNV